MKARSDKRDTAEKNDEYTGGIDPALWKKIMYGPPDRPKPVRLPSRFRTPDKQPFISMW